MTTRPENWFNIKLLINLHKLYFSLYNYQEIRSA